MNRFLKLAIAAAVVACFAALTFYLITQPKNLAGGLQLDAFEPDLANGQQVFWASGCSSCHAKKGASEGEKLLLGGGHRLDTPFGVFITPNISPDMETGIGNWDIKDFARSMILGQSPSNEHYYPAFPYSSYRSIQQQDLVDLFGYLKSLPAVSRQNENHELLLPFRWRRVVGGWKWMFLSDQPPTYESDGDPLMRGRYLVEVLAHCGECHTPRNALGGLDTSRKLAGGPAPESDGVIPNITPHADGIGSWSAGDIAYYLESGFTPDFDSVGGSMVSVQENMSKLSAEDRIAIANYLKSVPPFSAK